LRTYGAVLRELVRKEAIEEVLNPTSPGFYSSVFLIPKPNGKIRKIINLRPLNRYVESFHFVMETPQSVLAQLQPRLWATSVDLSDAYFHIPVHRESRKYLRFVACGKAWQYKVICFGLKTAPHLFTRVVEPLVRWARGQGIHIHVYLDDWLIIHQDRAVLERQTQAVVQKATELGWMINQEKSALAPSQQFTYLGMSVDTEANRVRPTEKRVTALMEAAERIYKEATCSVRAVLSLIGKMISVAPMVPFGALERRPLQFAMARVWSGTRGSLDAVVSITAEMRTAVRWWTCRENLVKGVPLATEREEVTLVTDASMTGWGAHLGSNTVSGLWSRLETSYHINQLEMLAVERAVKHFVHQIRSCRVNLLSDNTTVVAYVNKQGGTRSASLNAQASGLIRWTAGRDIELRARHIPGNRNVLADRLSRPGAAISSEWMLHRDLFRQITRVRWIPTVDLFATRWNAQVDQFVSPFPDERAVETDALSLDWADLQWPYLFPPVAILGKCLEKIQQVEGVFLLVAPLWPNRVWFPHLLNLCVDDPLEIPVWRTTLSQGLHKGARKVHQCPQMLNLHVWTLSSSPCRREAFLNRLRREQQGHRDLQRAGCMSGGGQPSQVGCTEEGFRILARPLFS